MDVLSDCPGGGTLFPDLPVMFHLPRDEPETGIAPARSRQTSLPAG
ncbi:hypothetical protein J2X76_001647 [Neorhizobium sp. 2083]|nr:hypothetical protein [Neorhizobium sp. 2083]MDR6816474.1 hypothetical protein [Neorhizobium sp. 2083]